MIYIIYIYIKYIKYVYIETKAIPMNKLHHKKVNCYSDSVFRFQMKSFHATALFLHILKASENHRFFRK